MSENNKKRSSVSVTDDITPITQEPINAVDSTDWTNLNIAELYDQRITINKRMMYASQIGNISMVQQLQRGLESLDAIIASKSKNTEDRLL